MDPKKVFGEAAKTFKKHSAKHSGGSALGDLNPEPVFGLASSGIDLDTQVATQHGGKKRSTKRSAKKRSAKHSAKRSAKKRSTKRGGGSCPACKMMH
jgi:hypothetical protein